MSDHTGDPVPIEVLLAKDLRLAFPRHDFPNADDDAVVEMAGEFAESAEHAIAHGNVNRQEAIRMAHRILDVLGGPDTHRPLDATETGPHDGGTDDAKDQLNQADATE